MEIRFIKNLLKRILYIVKFMQINQYNDFKNLRIYVAFSKILFNKNTTSDNINVNIFIKSLTSKLFE